MIEPEVVNPNIGGRRESLPLWGRTVGAEEFVYYCQTGGMACGCEVVVWRREGQEKCVRRIYDSGFFMPPMPRRIRERIGSGTFDAERARTELEEHKEEFAAEINEQLQQMLPLRDECSECSLKEWNRLMRNLEKSGLLADWQPEEGNVMAEGEDRLVASIGGRLYDRRPWLYSDIKGGISQVLVMLRQWK
jgi:hypothetical protein